MYQSPERKKWQQAAPSAWRAKRLVRPVPIRFDAQERQFLLYRLQWDRQAMIDTILANTSTVYGTPPYTGEQIARQTDNMVRELQNSPDKPFLVIGSLATILLIEAVEGNRYFSRMPDNDPRLISTAVKKVDALRQKISIAVHKPIRQVFLGEGREWLP